MEKWMAVLDFSGVYRQVRFWEEQENTAYLDLTRQQGTNCYCDDEAAEQIRQKLAGLGPEGIHFLDSGNYHYVTKLWTDLIREPFDLLVLDHHTDMQEPAFGGILSCGGWLRTILKENPHLGKVYLAGPPREAAMEDGVSDFGERVFFTDEEGMRRASWKELLGGRLVPLLEHPLPLAPPLYFPGQGHSLRRGGGGELGSGGGQPGGCI